MKLSRILMFGAAAIALATAPALTACKTSEPGVAGYISPEALTNDATAAETAFNVVASFAGPNNASVRNSYNVLLNGRTIYKNRMAVIGAPVPDSLTALWAQNDALMNPKPPT